MWNDPVRLDRLSRLLLIVAIIGTFFMVFAKISQMKNFAVKKIIIIGKLHEDTKSQLIEVIHDELRGGFFTIDLTQTKLIFEKLTRVRTVNVKRTWPNALEILIFEHQPLAIWDQNKFISHSGEIVEADVAENIAKNLPIFLAPENIVKDLITFYYRSDKVLGGIQKTVKRITVDDRYAWEVELLDGVVLRLGKEKQLERLYRFVDVYNHAVVGFTKRIDYVDMRYEDGFAIGTKS